ncbi:hypothetical protein [Nonomuraea jiangxiensis]|uniref:hypothetical protein n=1 Tax=Nonomuraea jiangxiensis TaxID=633440 RepID=UPI003183CD52
MVVFCSITKRVGAAVAPECYVDKSPPPPPREKTVAVAVRAHGAGHPTKRERCSLDKLLARPMAEGRGRGVDHHNQYRHHQELRVLFYRAAVDLSHQTLNYVAGVIRRHRGFDELTKKPSWGYNRHRPTVRWCCAHTSGDGCLEGVRRFQTPSRVRVSRP